MKLNKIIAQTKQKYRFHSDSANGLMRVKVPEVDYSFVLFFENAEKNSCSDRTQKEQQSSLHFRPINSLFL